MGLEAVLVILAAVSRAAASLEATLAILAAASLAVDPQAAVPVHHYTLAPLNKISKLQLTNIWIAYKLKSGAREYPFAAVFTTPPGQPAYTRSHEPSQCAPDWRGQPQFFCVSY